MDRPKTTVTPESKTAYYLALSSVHLEFPVEQIMRLCHYCLSCLRTASPLPAQLEASEDLTKVVAPPKSLFEQPEQRSFTEPGQDSTDRPHIAIPESQSLIFTDNSATKPTKKAKSDLRKERKHLGRGDMSRCLETPSRASPFLGAGNYCARSFSSSPLAAVRFQATRSRTSATREAAVSEEYIQTSFAVTRRKLRVSVREESPRL